MAGAAGLALRNRLRSRKSGRGWPEALSLWLSLLIVAAVIFLLAGILGFLGMRLARKASPPPTFSGNPGGGLDAQDVAWKWLSAVPPRSGRMAVERRRLDEARTGYELSCAR